MNVPSVAELRPVCQPPTTMDRRNGEHWAGRWYMRRISIHATRVFLALGWSPNSLTWLMIVAGLLGAAALLIPGIVGALLAVLLVQAYLLLDCSDGEVARWTKRTSATGVYLDRIGHHMCEAALMIGAGARAAQSYGESGAVSGFTTLGFAAAVGVLLVKTETDLVHVARAAHGLAPTTDADLAPRSSGLALARRVASVLKIHRITGAIEASLLLLVAAVIDTIQDDLVATRVLVIAFAVVALAMVVLHLASIIASRRLR